MPGIRLHMTSARELALDLRIPAIDADLGAYYLGATAPDIRALTRWDRKRTHFFDLDDFSEQDGVHRLFEHVPALRDAAVLDPPTAAFMAGYISHLVMDEDYITQIYRPLFGAESELRDDAMADIMDKSLQWDIERGECDEGKANEIRVALAETAVEVSVDFIARDTLAQWRDISVETICAVPSVDRLVRFLGRRMPAARLDDDERAARFAEEVPALLQRCWDHVGEARVRDYLGSTKARARSAIKEYLS